MLERRRSFWGLFPRLAIATSLCAAALVAGFRAEPAASAKPPLVRISIQPAIASLIPGQTLTLRAIGRYADGSVRDLTHFCDLTLEQPGVALLDEDRFLTPLKDGVIPVEDAAPVAKASEPTEGGKA